MNNQVKIAIISILVIIPIASYSVWASDRNTVYDSNQSLEALASFYPLYEFSQKVAKDKIHVDLLVPIGIEPHDWEPTIKDVQKIQQSDFVIINGIGFENWADNLDEINFQGTVIDTSKGIVSKHNEIFESQHETDEDSHDHGPNDPHVWLVPSLAKIQVQNIADAFSELDPENHNFYQQNAADYKLELDELDSKIRKDLSGCKKDFISFHDAFSFFAEEYDLHQHTILSSNDPHGEPSSKTLETVINTAKKFDIKIIFTEETANPRTSQVIADEIGGKILVLSPIEIENEKSYIQRMNENLNNLKEALC